MMKAFETALFSLVLIVVLAGPGCAQRAEPLPAELEGVTVTEKLNARIPLDLEFVDSQRNKVHLTDYFDGKKPVILTLNYYGCPMLCGLQLNGLLDGLKKLDWVAGKEFDIVTVSFDPGETPILAKNKKQNYLREYGRPEAAGGWHFLTGREKDIQALTESVGFGYRYDEKTDQYVHAAVAIVATPNGRVSRYLYGVIYDPNTLRLSLVEAGEGKVGSPFDRFFLFCYHYDATEGRYAIAAIKVMRFGGFLTLLVLAVFLVRYWVKETQKRIPDPEGQQT
jgi:protein SCO1/2